MTTGSGMKFYKDGELHHEIKAEGTFAIDPDTPRPNLGAAVKEMQPEPEQRMRIDGAGHLSPKPWPTQFDNDPSRWYEQIGKLPKREWVDIPYVSHHDSPKDYDFTHGIAWAVGYNDAIDKLKEKNT